jgi:hypothetical protein
VRGAIERTLNGMPLMTTQQDHILDLIWRLPLEQRRELLDKIYDTEVLGRQPVGSLTSELEADLRESIAQEDRGDVFPADEVFAAIAEKYGLTRS